jgi:hypothetical protein
MLNPVTSMSGAPSTIQFGHQPADAAAGEDAQGVEARGDEKVAQLGRFAHQRREVGREALGAAEELAHAGASGGGHALEGVLHEGHHAVDVGLDLAEGELLGNAVQRPGRGHGLEDAEHQPAALLAQVGVVGRVLQDGPAALDALHTLQDQVVVLGGLERNVHPGQLSDLAPPHARTVDHVLGGDGSAVRHHARHAAALLGDARERDALEDAHTRGRGALRQGHGHVHGIGAAVPLGEETPQQVVGPGQRPQLLYLRRREIPGLDAHQAIEAGLALQVFEDLLVGGDLEQAHRVEAGGVPRLLLQPGVEIPGVLGDPHRGLGGEPRRHDQARCVPRGARRELVALEQDHVGPAALGQVVGHVAADDAAADDDHSGGGRQGIALDVPGRSRASSWSGEPSLQRATLVGAKPRHGTGARPGGARRARSDRPGASRTGRPRPPRPRAGCAQAGWGPAGSEPVRASSQGGSSFIST